MVLKRCSSERGEREKRFYGDGKDERRRTAFCRAAQNSLNASGAKLTRVCVTRTVNGTGQEREGYGGPCDVTSLSLSLKYILVLARQVPPQRQP